MLMKAVPTWFDNIVGFFSPRRKMNRLRYRAATQLIEGTRKYEGAAVGRRTDGWTTSSTSANTEISAALTKLRNRSRDLVRNNPYAARGIQVIESNVIGPGIRADIKHNTQRTQATLRDTWDAWAMTPAIDYDGRQNIFGLQRAIMRAVVESGEIFLRSRVSSVLNRVVSPKTGKLLTVPPIQIQMLESDFLDSTQLTGTNSETGNRIIQGIEIDENGKRVAYYLFKEHPGGNDMFPGTFESVRVPASEIIHIYRQDRPGQLRGTPWLSSIMLRLRDFDEYEDAQLVRQKIASCLTAFVHDLQGLDESVECETELGEKMEPGQIEFLPPGKSVTLSSPPSTPGYAEYTSVVLHSIAAGMGITFEAMTGNLSEVSFSSARMGHLEFSRNINSWRQNIMISQCMDPVFNWFLGGMEFIGLRTSGATRSWSSPRREMVDPSKEVDAIKTQIRSGLLTQSEAVRMAGHDPDKHFEEMKSDNDRLDSLQLTLDTDPRQDPDRISAENISSEQSNNEE